MKLFVNFINDYFVGVSDPNRYRAVQRVKKLKTTNSLPAV